MKINSLQLTETAPRGEDLRTHCRRLVLETDNDEAQRFLSGIVRLHVGDGLPFVQAVVRAAEEVWPSGVARPNGTE